jgi:hypothetical protein
MYHWSARPLHTHIIEYLYAKNGRATDADLYQALTKTYGELSHRELNKALMNLEIQGLIHVSRLTTKLRQIEAITSYYTQNPPHETSRFASTD